MTRTSTDRTPLNYKARLAPAVLLTLLLAVAAGCTAPAPAGPFHVGAAQEAAIIEAINRVRGARGLAPLAHEERLGAIARAHSQDMAARGFFAHRGSDGRAAADRARANGIAFGMIAENLFRVSRRPVEDPLLASRVVEGWMRSPAHRDNILNPALTHGAAGLAANGRYVLGTFVFATPPDDFASTSVRVVEE